jgi:hypothetical protein
MKKQEENRRFESELLGMPPLKMILLNLDADERDRPRKKTAVPRKSAKDLENLKAVVKLIDHLTELE